MKKFALLCALILSAQVAFAGMDHPAHTAPVMPKDFETLKKLVGTWEGTSKMGDKEMPVKVVYELTSGGSVIAERTMAGTPQEMISVYHKEGKGLAMTHYCSIGNHPHMVLKNATANSLHFEMARSSDGLTSAKEMHMHALTLTLNGNDSLTQEWTSFDMGKSHGAAVFHLKRK